MTTPTEDEVRAWLEQYAATHETLARMFDEDDPDGSPVAPELAANNRGLSAKATAALALLDEARKDRERLDWIDGAFWCDYARSAGGVAEITAGTLVTHLATGEGDTVRAAIDQARGA